MGKIRNQRALSIGSAKYEILLCTFITVMLGRHAYAETDSELSDKPVSMSILSFDSDPDIQMLRRVPHLAVFGDVCRDAKPAHVTEDREVWHPAGKSPRSMWYIVKGDFGVNASVSGIHLPSRMHPEQRKMTPIRNGLI